ncbi:MAG: SDR family oxidoreductase [Nitrospiria bacterium]
MTSTTLLFGGSSILGFNLAKAYLSSLVPYVPKANHAASLDHWPVLNLEDPAWIKQQFEAHAPKVLIYGHAVCDVAKCEADPAWADEINVHHVRRVVDALPDTTRLVYISSDHVFGGDGRYTESTPSCPISVYGRTRVATEQWVLKRKNTLVIRTGLAIGPSPDGRSGHLDWLRYRSDHGLPLTIIEDEHRSVVWARDLAKRVMQLSESDVCGVRHIPATQVVSRVTLAKHLFHSLGKTPTFKIECRNQQPVPHLGYVGLESRYDDAFSEALPSVMVPSLQ